MKVNFCRSSWFLVLHFWISLFKNNAKRKGKMICRSWLLRKTSSFCHSTPSSTSGWLSSSFYLRRVNDEREVQGQWSKVSLLLESHCYFLSSHVFFSLFRCRLKQWCKNSECGVKTKKVEILRIHISILEKFQFIERTQSMSFFMFSTLDINCV